MRRSMERRMNASLKGYTVQHSEAPLLPLRPLRHAPRPDRSGSRRIPEPPVIVVPRLKASVQWRGAPHRSTSSRTSCSTSRASTSTFRSCEAENRDATPVKDKGWQDARRGDLPVQDQPLPGQRRATSSTSTEPEGRRSTSRTSPCARTTSATSIRGSTSIPRPIHAEGVIFETGRGARRPRGLPREAASRDPHALTSSRRSRSTTCVR